jgi:Transketolase
MEKRYQVFVSSTYEDLQEERKEVMQALLELDCIPAGMELFPASNEDQWTLIKRVIDDCDYYIVIIGGRYGSTNKDGTSYTEMEYRYALSKEKPIIAFLHKNPGEIKSKYVETTEDGKIKLQEFRELAKNKMIKYWTNPSDLGGVVSRSMINLKKQFPAIGWIKADSEPDSELLKEILNLKKENELLKTKLVESKTQAPLGSEKLAQGEDALNFELNVFSVDQSNISSEIKYILKGCTTWDALFAHVAPHIIPEITESKFKNQLVNHAKNVLSKEIEAFERENRNLEIKRFSISDSLFQKAKIQIRALGYIKEIQQNSSCICNWALTEYGEFIMNQIIAVKHITPST